MHPDYESIRDGVFEHYLCIFKRRFLFIVPKGSYALEILKNVVTQRNVKPRSPIESRTCLWAKSFPIP
jgi:hypothetical protein